MLSGICVFFSIIVMAASDKSKYFPKTTDLSKVTWAHAVNNKILLRDALNSEVIMLEADISIGKLSPNDKIKIPIMAHPPATISDLSLKEFLSTVNSHNMNNSGSHKGVKLDFKSIEAFTESVSVLKENLKDLNPVWLNADILPGPVDATVKPLNATQFITVSNNEFSNIILSIGWTTNYNKSYIGKSYTEQQIDDMISTINVLQIQHPITFPVRAGLAAESCTVMKTLINNVTSSSLTIWSSENDPVDLKKLRFLIMTIGLNKVYIDVPKQLNDQLDLPSLRNGSSYI